MFLDRFLRFFPRSNYKNALRSFNRGDYKRACRLFERYVNKHSESEIHNEAMLRMYVVEAYFQYSKELVSKGKYGEAAPALERALQFEPNYADIRATLGNVYFELGKFQKAIENYKLGLEVNPRYFKARVMLAKTHFSNGDYHHCAEELENSLSAAPAFYVNKINQLIDIVKDRGSFEESDWIFQSLLEEKPSSAQVSKQIALKAIQQGNLDFALSELRKAVKAYPNFPDLHNLLGIAYGNKGMNDDSIIEFEKALKIHPDYLKARINLSLMHYEKGCSEEAMRHLERILELDPSNVLARNIMDELQPV